MLSLININSATPEKEVVKLFYDFMHLAETANDWGDQYKYQKMAIRVAGIMQEKYSVNTWGFRLKAIMWFK